MCVLCNLVRYIDIHMQLYTKQLHCYRKNSTMTKNSFCSIETLSHFVRESDVLQHACLAWAGTTLGQESSTKLKTHQVHMHCQVQRICLKAAISLSLSMHWQCHEGSQLAKPAAASWSFSSSDKTQCWAISLNGILSVADFIVMVNRYRFCHGHG